MFTTDSVEVVPIMRCQLPNCPYESIAYFMPDGCPMTQDTECESTKYPLCRTAGWNSASGCCLPQLREITIANQEHLYYDDGMELSLIPQLDALTEPQRGCHVLIESRAATEPLLRFAARMALESRVNILDAGGMHFDVHRAARLLRQQSTEVYTALERIQLARAFNACQLTDALKAFESDAAPIVIMDALGLFEGDVLNGRRERYILMEYYAALQHLGSERLVLAGIRPAPKLAQYPWRVLLQQAVRVYEMDETQAAPSASQPDLFGGAHG